MSEVGAKAAKILVVDDSPDSRNLISVLLQQLGCKDILIVHSGKEALTILRRKKFDLILCDWVMPEMDGLTLWGTIKEDDRLKKIPFVLLTAVNEIEKIKEAISQGVADYIVKPFTLKTLTNKIEKALGMTNIPK